MYIHIVTPPGQTDVVFNEKSKPQNKCGPISILRIIHNHMLTVVGHLNYVNHTSQLQILNFIMYEL